MNKPTYSITNDERIAIDKVHRAISVYTKNVDHVFNKKTFVYYAYFKSYHTVPVAYFQQFLWGLKFLKII